MRRERFELSRPDGTWFTARRANQLPNRRLCGPVARPHRLSSVVLGLAAASRMQKGRPTQLSGRLEILVQPRNLAGQIMSPRSWYSTRKRRPLAASGVEKEADGTIGRSSCKLLLSGIPNPPFRGQPCRLSVEVGRVQSAVLRWVRPRGCPRCQPTFPVFVEAGRNQRA